ncbi:hypothetical protein EGW08_017922 [Elysia chlorotica]|uniref:PNPLA domain-containing protein n=1 Tax=Elysia chlorotica TaxID=188477 RepID=A0A3S0ZSQ3_ELYCH|nr:hypothetical protein EGW08_017922 [Elysia chlorotica]
MGNKCSCPCSRRPKPKEKPDSSNPALLIIREAQRKYFNSHIESDIDDSDDDLDIDQEDSVDNMYGSVDSLDVIDSVSVDSQLDESGHSSKISRRISAEVKSSQHAAHAGAENSSALPLLARTSSGLVANGVNDNEKGDGAEESKRDSGNGSATHIVPSGDNNSAAPSSTTAADDADHAHNNCMDGSRNNSFKGEDSTKRAEDNASENDNTTKQSGGNGARPNVKRRDKKRKFISLSRRGDFFSIFNTEDKKARSVDPSKYEYPFENLVFEGGGNKGLAYCGAVRLLEELNIWPQVKRLAGSSAGAMTAALLAVGYNSHDLEQFFSLNLNNIFLDHRFGYLSLIPNLLTSYGWNPGKRIYKWFGHKMADRTGDPDITFKEVYEMYQRELCVVATNLNQMTSLYCHPKTTPDMPVRLAVRMSMSIPGMFKAVTHTMYGQTDVFVDGGVLCNYPIHCFDGWWLSMEPENNFLEKLQPLEDIPRLLERTERFGQYNEKTLGMQLYSDNEQDLLKYQLENLRHGVQLQELPNTKLAREKIRKKKLQLKTDREHRRLVKAMNAFLRALRKHNLDKNDNIDRSELEAALNDQELFPRSKRLILFGDVDCDVILEYLDRDHNGQISYQELLRFMEETGISMQNRFLGYQRRSIKNLPSFLDTLQATLLTNVKRVYVEERDLKRTVGINTGHVGTSDFCLEPADIEFVLERGKRSLEAFLKYYVASKRLKKKPEFRKAVPRKDSKSSILSSDSNSSLGNQEDGQGLSGLSYSVASTLRKAANGKVLSPIPSESDNTGEFEYPAESDFSADSSKPALRNISCNAFRSTAPGKSVSISDHVIIMADRPSSGNASEMQSDSIAEESWEEQEDIGLLAKSSSSERMKETTGKSDRQKSLSLTACEVHVHHKPGTHSEDPASPLLETSSLADESFQMLRVQNH